MQVSTNKQTARADLLQMYQAALQSVAGDKAVEEALRAQTYQQDCHIIAIGKGADAMTRGAMNVLHERIISGIAINKAGDFSEQLLHDPRIDCVEGEHPIPSEKSLAAGQALLAYIQQLPEDATCLVLFSGGASSLVEVLAEGWTLDDLQALTRYLLGSGYDINAMNAVRRRVSQIKGGGLWQFLGQRSVTALLISDVPHDDPQVIGSGVLFPVDEAHDVLPDLPEQWINRLPKRQAVQQGAHFQWSIIASLALAKQAAYEKAKSLGYEAQIVDEFMEGYARDAAQHIVHTLTKAPLGLSVWGGETTVVLPENPGLGGRNLHVALSAAVELQDKPTMMVLSASTDGIDGVTQEAGAIVDSHTLERGEQQGLNAEDCLQRADAYTFLSASEDLIHTGATGTNVMDLVLGLVMSHDIEQ